MAKGAADQKKAGARAQDSNTRLSQQEFNSRDETARGVFKENMARAGNPVFGDSPDSAFSTSTAGTQALKSFNSNWKLLEDAERRGELTAGIESLNTSVGLNSALRGEATDIASSLRNVGQVTGSRPGFGGGVPNLGTGALLPGYINALQPYQMQRAGQFQADVMNQQSRDSRFAGLMNLVGTGAGAGSAAALATLSSKKYKKNIKEVDDKKALSLLRKTKMYTWKYKTEPTSTPLHHGPIVEYSPKEIVAYTGEHIDVISHMGLMHSALRALDKKVSRRVANGR